MKNTFEVDLSGFNASIQRLYNLDKVRRKDITDVFRKADKGIISTAKATVKDSPKGVVSRKYPSRTHPSGTLRKSIGFKASRLQNMVYYVRAKAWYYAIYIRGHGSFMGNPFIERAVSIRGDQAERLVRKGLNELIQKVK